LLLQITFASLAIRVNSGFAGDPEQTSMSASRDELLQPTLSEQAQSAAPYSIQATFFTGFFGGPFAALAIIGVNSVRLRRLQRDVLVLTTLLALVLLVGWMFYATQLGLAMQAWLTETFGRGNLRFVSRLSGLLVVGAGYLLHRREQRNAELVGMKRPNGWIAGIACVVIGSALMLGYALLLSRV
jgi:hypothetical protein